MKYLYSLFLLTIFSFFTCEKDNELSGASKLILHKVEYSKMDLEQSRSDEFVKKELVDGYFCSATITISDVVETNPSDGFWRVRIHSNSWWPELYYEFREQGVYHITLPSDKSLSISLSALLYDWDCEELSAEANGNSSNGCEYSAYANITFNSDIDVFSERFETYTSSDYSNGMSYAINTHSCGVESK